MKKSTKLLTIGLGAIAALNFSSCSDYTEFTEQEIKFAEYNKKYDEAFVKAFGQIDPNNGFGMDEPLQNMGWGAVTRAGDVDTRRNMWVDREGNDNPYSSNPYKTDALAHDIVIPGWPNFDGLYYGNYGGTALQHKWTAENLPNGAQPCGDVTDYEIQYVSAWFRTHRIEDPQNYREELHLSDFFIQNVSCDNDQKEYNDINNADQTGFNGANVLTGTDQGAYNNINRISGQEQVNFSLDQLGFKDMDNNWTHINNFNNQNSNYNPEEANSTPNREIKYVTASGTEWFQCHPSFSTKDATNWIDSWVLVRLTWKEKVTDENSPKYNQIIDREGYYLAFDFKADKDETRVAGDGYYSNWIVKITPGHFAPTGVAKRVMCEDLGGTFDFDFNDVVFDIAKDGSGVPVISVQAAGGTLPVWVEKSDATPICNSNYELHKLLGAPTSQPVNVMGDYSNQHAPAIFRLNSAQGIENLHDLKIVVDNKGHKYSISGESEDRANLNYPGGNPYGSPTNKIGTEAPRAFAVPTDVKWMKELEYIDKSYPGFKYWVDDVNWTYQPSEEATPLKWYQQSKVQDDMSPVTSYMYYPGIVMKDGSPEGWKQTLPTEWTTLELADAAYTHAGEVNAFGSVWIDGYTGGASIIKNLKDNNAQMITLTVIFKSKTEYPLPEYNSSGELTNGSQLLKAILIPADMLTADEKTAHSGALMKYKGTYFNKDIIKSWRIAQLQAYAGQDENSLMKDKDFTGYTYTYAFKMTFTREQLLQTTDPEDFVDHIFLFIESPDNANVKVFNWHVHY